MSVPFLWPAIGFAFGITLERYSGSSSLGAIAVGGLIVPLLFLMRGRKVFLPLLVLAIGCAGFLWARFDGRVSEDAIQRFAGADRVTLRGEVCSLPEVKARGKRTTVSLVLKVRSITRRDGERWKRQRAIGPVQVFLIQCPVVPQVGDELRLYGTLGTPRTVLNPGEFDYGEFLAQKKIHAVFQAIGGKSVRVTKQGNPWSLSRLIAEARRSLAALADQLFGERQSAIVKALVLGIRSDVAPEVRNQFMKTGTVHLLAISGMNITMIAGTFYLIFLLAGIGFRGASLVTALIVTVYIGLAGAGIPIQRAGYSAVLVLLGTLAGRPTHLLNALCLSFVVILAWMPQSLWNVGFQLSFLCVLSLILILPLFSHVNLWTLSMGSSLSVLAGTFPVILYYFNIFSPVSLLANLVAIPLCDAALFTALFALLLGGIPLLGPFCVMISSGIITGVLAWVKVLSSWRWGYWFLERPALWEMGLYYAALGGLLLMERRSFPGKRLWTTCLFFGWLGTAMLMSVGPSAHDFELTLLASGGNQVAHARFSNGTEWMFNAGRSFPSDQGEWLTAPYLKTRGIQRLEGVFLADLSKKNTGGLPALLRDFPARYLLYPDPLPRVDPGLYRMIRKFRGTVQGMDPGDEVRMGAEKITVIARSRKHVALGVCAGPWRIVLISGWDAELFEELLRGESREEVHAVLLPSGASGIPEGFYAWIRRFRPQLLVSPGLPLTAADFLSRESVPFLDPHRTGAVTFSKKGDRLELHSFLNGSLGFFTYS